MTHRIAGFGRSCDVIHAEIELVDQMPREQVGGGGAVVVFGLQRSVGEEPQCATGRAQEHGHGVPLTGRDGLAQLSRVGIDARRNTLRVLLVAGVPALDGRKRKLGLRGQVWRLNHLGRRRPQAVLEVEVLGE
eukprot:scaffold197857_cov35-Tisochrysis_lutea.AAC.1